MGKCAIGVVGGVVVTVSNLFFLGVGFIGGVALMVHDKEKKGKTTVTRIYDPTKENRR